MKSIDPETELRKMLYEKLCIAKKKKKSKPSSRYKFYVSESDESSDDSE
jgi:hypothetical protein